MRVLVACEFSGVVRDAFAARGHEVISCDLLDTQSERWHYNGDVFDIIHYPFDLMVAHPPCTHLSVSGARHFTEKRKDGRQTEGGGYGQLLTLASQRQWRINGEKREIVVVFLCGVCNNECTD